MPVELVASVASAQLLNRCKREIYSLADLPEEVSSKVSLMLQKCSDVRQWGKIGNVPHPTSCQANIFCIGRKSLLLHTLGTGRLCHWLSDHHNGLPASQHPLPAPAALLSDSQCTASVIHPALIHPALLREAHFFTFSIYIYLTAAPGAPAGAGCASYGRLQGKDLCTSISYVNIVAVELGLTKNYFTGVLPVLQLISYKRMHNRMRAMWKIACAEPPPSSVPKTCEFRSPIAPPVLHPAVTFPPRGDCVRLPHAGTSLVKY